MLLAIAPAPTSPVAAHPTAPRSKVAIFTHNKNNAQRAPLLGLDARLAQGPHHLRGLHRRVCLRDVLAAGAGEWPDNRAHPPALRAALTCHRRGAAVRGGRARAARLLPGHSVPIGAPGVGRRAAGRLCAGVRRRAAAEQLMATRPALPASLSASHALDRP